MKNALTIWLIWRDLLVRSGMASSRSACVSLRNASFHIDWQNELDFVSFYTSGGRDESRNLNLFCTFGLGEVSAFLPCARKLLARRQFRKPCCSESVSGEPKLWYSSCCGGKHIQNNEVRQSGLGTSLQTFHPAGHVSPSS